MGKKKAFFGWLPWFRKCKKDQNTEFDNKPAKSSTMSLNEKKEKKGKKFSSLPDIFRAAVGKKKNNKTPADSNLGVRTLQKEASKSSLSDDELHPTKFPVELVKRSRELSTSTSDSDIGKERKLQKIPTPRKKKRPSNKTKTQDVTANNEIRTSENLEFSKAKLSIHRNNSSSSSDSEEGTKQTLNRTSEMLVLPIKKKDVKNATQENSTVPPKNSVTLKKFHHRSSTSSSSNNKAISKVLTRTVAVQVNFEPALVVPLNVNASLKNSSSISSEDSNIYATPKPQTSNKQQIFNANNSNIAQTNANLVMPLFKKQESLHNEVILGKTPVLKHSSSSSSSSQENLDKKSKNEKIVVAGHSLPDKKDSFQTTIVQPQRTLQNVVVKLPAQIKPTCKDSSSSSSSQEDEKIKVSIGDIERRPALSDNRGSFQTIIVTPQRPHQEIMITLPPTTMKPNRRDSRSSSSSEDDKIEKNKEKPLPTSSQSKNIVFQQPLQLPPLQNSVATPVTYKPKNKKSSSSSSSEDEKEKICNQEKVDLEKLNYSKNIEFITPINLPQRSSLKTLVQNNGKNSRSSSSSSEDDSKIKEQLQVEKQAFSDQNKFQSTKVTSQLPSVPTTHKTNRSESSSSSFSQDDDTEKKELLGVESHGTPDIKDNCQISITKTPREPQDIKIMYPTTVKPSRKDSSSSSSSSAQDLKITKVENLARISILSSETPQLELLDIETQKSTKIVPDQKTNISTKQKSMSSSSSDDNVQYENVTPISSFHKEKKSSQKYGKIVQMTKKTSSSSSSSSDISKSPKPIRAPVPKARLMAFEKVKHEQNKNERSSDSSNSSSESSKKDTVKLQTDQILPNNENIYEVFPVFRSSLSEKKTRQSTSDSDSSEKSVHESSPHRYYSAEENNVIDGYIKKSTTLQYNSPITNEIKKDRSNSSSSSSSLKSITETKNVNIESEKMKISKQPQPKLQRSSSESSLESLTNKNSFRSKAMEYSKLLQQKINKKFNSHPQNLTNKLDIEGVNKNDNFIPSFLVKVDKPMKEKERSSSSSSSEKSLEFKMTEQKSLPLSNNNGNKKLNNKNSFSIQEGNITQNKPNIISLETSLNKIAPSSSADSDTSSHKVHIKKKGSRSSTSSLDSLQSTTVRTADIIDPVPIEEARSRSSSDSSVESLHRTRKNTEIFIPSVPINPVTMTVSHKGFNEKDKRSSSSSSHEDISQGSHSSKNKFGIKVKEISGDIQKFFKGKRKPHSHIVGKPSVSVQQAENSLTYVSEPDPKDRSNSIHSTSSHSTLSIGESTDASAAKVKSKSKVGNVLQQMRDKRNQKKHKKSSSESSFSLESPKLNLRHKAKEFSDELKQKLQRKPKTILRDKASDSDIAHDDDTLDSNKFIESLYEGSTSHPVVPPAHPHQSSPSPSDTSESENNKTTKRNTVILQLPDNNHLQQNAVVHLSSKSSSESSLNSSSKPNFKTQTKDMFKNIKHKIYDKKDKKVVSSSNDSLNTSSVFYTENHMSKAVETPEKSDLSFKAKLDFFENNAHVEKEKLSSESSDNESKIKSKTKAFTNKIRHKFSKHKHDEQPELGHVKDISINEVIKLDEVKLHSPVPKKHISSSSSSSDNETSEKRRDLNSVILPHGSNYPIAYNVDVLTIRDTNKVHSSASVIATHETIKSDTFHKQTSVSSETSIPTPILRTKIPPVRLINRKSSSSSSDENITIQKTNSYIEHSNKNDSFSNPRASYTSSISFSSNDFSPKENTSEDRKDSLNVMDAVATVIQQYRFSNPKSPTRPLSSGNVYTFKKTAELKSAKSLESSLTNTSNSIVTTRFSPLNTLELKKEPSNVFQIQSSDRVMVKSILIASESSCSEKSTRVEGKKLRPAPAPPKQMETKTILMSKSSSSSSSSSSASDNEENQTSTIKITHEEQEASIYLSDNNMYEC